MKVRFLLFLLLVLLVISATSPIQAEFGASIHYFAQFAARGGATTSFVVHNPTSQEITVRLKLFERNGNVFSNQQVTLAPGATKTVVYGGSKGTMKVGWARLSSESKFTVTEFFEISIGGEELPRVGVLPSSLSTECQLFSFLSPGETNTGIAVANPSPRTTAKMTVSIYDAQGEFIESKVIHLAPLQQLARYLNEPDLFPDLSTFEGAVKVTTNIPVIMLTVRADGDL